MEEDKLNKIEDNDKITINKTKKMRIVFQSIILFNALFFFLFFTVPKDVLGGIFFTITLALVGALIYILVRTCSKSITVKQIKLYSYLSILLYFLIIILITELSKAADPSDYGGGFVSMFAFYLFGIPGMVMAIIFCATTISKFKDSKQLLQNADKEAATVIKNETNESQNLAISSEVSYCKYCGNKMDEGSMFCKYCGKKLD